MSLQALAAETAAPSPVLDDFSDAQHTTRGAARFVADDHAMGSHSQATQVCDKGILTVRGELAPGRGLPAFISIPLLAAPDASAQDLSQYEGVRIRVKVTKGILSVQVSTSDIKNFDYHSSGPVVGKPGGFQEVRVPFRDLKRGWSEQTALNLKAVTSVNLVSFGMAKDSFGYEVDEIGFY